MGVKLDQMPDDHVDWSAALGDDFAGTIARARDLSECRRLAVIAGDAAQNAVDATETSRDAAVVAKEAAAQCARMLGEYERTARVVMWLSVAVLVACVSTAVLNFLVLKG